MNGVTVTAEWLRERCAEDGDCLVWKLSTSHNGHPRYTFRPTPGAPKSGNVRRLVWLGAGHPPLKAKQVICMDCKNPLCLNHEHMVVRTRRDVIVTMSNTAAVRAKKVAAQQRIRRATAKITLEQARYARDSDKPLTVVAAELGVSAAWVSKIRRNQCWRDIQANPFAGLLA